jgi:hypothetical protein
MKFFFMILENSGAGLFALPKGVAGDWKSLRELLGSVVLFAARRLQKGLLAPFQSPGRGNTPAPQYLA